MIAPGFVPGGVNDRVIFHKFAQQWPKPTGVTQESWDKWQAFKSDPRCVTTFEDAREWEDVTAQKNLDSYFPCPCCHSDCRKGLLICLNCWGVFTWEYPPWAESLVSPLVRPPTDEELAAVQGMVSTAEGLLAAQLYMVARE